MEIGEMIKLPKGTIVGMVALRYDTDARVTHLDKDENGKQIARVEWIDIKGRTKFTWIIPN